MTRFISKKALLLTARLFIVMLVAAPIGGVVCSCGDDSKEENPISKPDKIKISGVIIPNTLTVPGGGEFTITGNGFQEGDIFLFEGTSTYELPVVAVSENSATLVLPEGMFSGSYSIRVKRGESSVYLGKTVLSVTAAANIPTVEGKSLYGMVYCNGVGVEGVKVSDGYEIVTTDSKGLFYMSSEKRHGYCFIIVPSGYRVGSKSGFIPEFFKYTSEAATVAERVDFEIFEDEIAQDAHEVLICGDMHLAARNNDRNQFAEFTSEIANYVKANGSKNIRLLTLGDMVWDLYWYDNNYEFANYIADMKAVGDVQVFHTIGNHDHEMGKAGAYPVGDFDTVIRYKAELGPTYYSFDVGQIHYVVIDDIQCTNPGNGQRTYVQTVVDDEIEWLKKDLSLIAKDTPVIVTLHAPIYKPDGGTRLSAAANFLECFNGHSNVHIFSAHTHVCYNVDKSNGGVFEHNAGAVCATWWWTGKYTPGLNISQDGAPAGYTIFSANGKEIKWQYKPTGAPVSRQFRSYDRNEMQLTAASYCPKANDTYLAEFNKYNGTWANQDNSNKVYVNVWNWDPEWTVEITENGNALKVDKVSVRDPLHIIAYNAMRCNANGSMTFPTELNAHTFVTTASAPNTTLEIKVTDRFGNVYTESMTRPKAFSLAAYK